MSGSIDKEKGLGCYTCAKRGHWMDLIGAGDDFIFGERLREAKVETKLIIENLLIEPLMMAKVVSSVGIQYMFWR